MESRIKVKPTIYKDNKEILSEIILKDGSIGIVKDTENYKAFKSENYNFFFNKEDGFFVRWGKGDYSVDCKDKITKQEVDLYLLWTKIWGKKLNLKDFVRDLESDPINGLPEIADIEISTACKQGCAFCYKDNKISGENMSLETFKKVFSKLVVTTTQIAFGITEIDANPDMWDIFDYTRSQGVIPNVTINGSGMKPEYFDKLAERCGAVAVSAYNKDNTYNTIKELTDRGMKQINIHQMICLENFDESMQILKDRMTDSRLDKLNAIVLLSLKPRGRAEGRFHKLPQEKFDELVNFALDNKIGIGFDSCGCHKFLKTIEKNSQYKYVETCAEPCESTLFSCFLNVKGNFYACSFCENNEGLSVLECKNFLKDIWYNKSTENFREGVINCRNSNTSCSVYDV